MRGQGIDPAAAVTVGDPNHGDAGGFSSPRVVFGVADVYYLGRGQQQVLERVLQGQGVGFLGVRRIAADGQRKKLAEAELVKEWSCIALGLVCYAGEPPSCATLPFE